MDIFPDDKARMGPFMKDYSEDHVLSFLCMNYPPYILDVKVIESLLDGLRWTVNLYFRAVIFRHAFRNK